MRRPSHGYKTPRSAVPIRTSNRFSALSDAPTEKPDESALVIGDSIVWNVKIETPDTRGRTGTTFQAGKSHTHPGHPIHPTTILKHGQPY